MGVIKTVTEKLHEPKGHEHKSENLDASAEASQNLERLQKEANKEVLPGDKVEQLHAQAKERAVSGKETTVGEKESRPSHTSVHKELKDSSYKQTLRHIQTKLRGSDKVLSRAMHQPVVEKLSNAGAKTIARPSGVLGGGFMALIGSSVLLYMTKHYGFEYNFTIFFLLFVTGFLAGLVLEGLLRLVRRKRVT